MIGCIYIVGACIIAVLVFLDFYFYQSRSRKDTELLPIVFKSIKFAGTLLIFLVVFTISQILCKHFHIGFGISFIISCLIALCFLWVVYRFNLGFSERSESKKKIEKLNNGLLDILNKKKKY